MRQSQNWLGSQVYPQPGPFETELGIASRAAARNFRPLRILFTLRHKADQANVERCMQELRIGGYAVTADIAVTPAQFTRQIDAHTYDAVLAEHPHPGWRGPQPVELLHRTGHDIPLILLTRAIQPDTVEAFIRTGVADCVEQEDLDRLARAVRRALREKALREQLNHVEEALRRSEAHYSVLLENPGYGMCHCAMDGRFLNVNQAMATMLDYASRDELLAGGPITDIVPDLDARAHALDRSHRSGRTEPVEIEWRKKDGTTLLVRFSAWIVCDEFGVPDGYDVIAEDVTLQRAHEHQLRRQADSDPLTDLANHRRLTAVLYAEIDRARRTGRKFSVVLMDLDDLKKVNDRHGHLAGNRALCRLADILRLCCRSIDTAARFGGDEFALVLPETGADAATQVAQRICGYLAGSREEPRLSVSIGVATYPQDGDTVETLLQRADRELYRMKGRKRSLF